LPQTHAPAKLLIETGVITEAEFPKKIADELATCRKAHGDSFRREGVGLAAQGDREKRATAPSQFNEILACEMRKGEHGEAYE
jgi:hypothetical protein